MREGDVAARIVIRRSGDLSGTAEVSWSTADGTAVADRDYADLGARLERFQPGESSRTIYVPLIDNFLDLLAGPMAVIAGIVATAAVTTDLPPLVRWSVAIVAGGGTAGVVQTVTSVVRLKSTMLTAGFGKCVVASFELIASLIASLIAILAPVIAIFLVIGILMLFLAFARKRTAADRPLT